MTDLPTAGFAPLGLKPELLATLTELDHLEPTPIQAAVIPPLLQGADVIGQAQTGAGKTAAFCLPILQNLVPGQNHIQALILAPTRELAGQSAEAMETYGRAIGVRTLAVYGGQSYSGQIRGLKQGVDVVIGAPGRVLDLINRGLLKVEAVSTVVLDEADEMLSMGFIEDIEAILEKTNPARQTALFSATMPGPIRQIAKKYMTEPQLHAMEQKQRTVDTIEQRYYLVNAQDKPAALARLLEAEDCDNVLVFAKTRQAVGWLAGELSNRNFPAEPLSGDLSQEARERTLNRFREGQIKIVVATDVAARGLDIEAVSHVVNFDPPQSPEVYVHRVGRTGRAGRSGSAISLLTPQEQWRLRRIETYTRQKITQAELPTPQAIFDMRDAKLIQQMEVWLSRNRCVREREMVDELIAAGYDPTDLAVAALKLARAEEKQRPIERISPIRDFRSNRDGKFEDRRFKGKTSWADRQARRGSRGGDHNRPGPGAGQNDQAQSDRAREKGMVRLILSRGQTDGLKVNQVVGAIARGADIPGSALGRISIHHDHAYVDVPESYVDQVLSKGDSYRLGRRVMQVKRA